MNINLRKKNLSYRIILGLSMLIIIIFGSSIAINNGHEFYLGNFEEYNNDDVKYIRSAQTLLEKSIFTYQNPDTPTVFIMPALPIILATLIKLFGFEGGILGFRLLQVLLVAGTLYLLYMISKILVHERVGAIIAIIFTIYLPNYMAANLVLTEVFAQFFLWLFLYLGIKAVKTKRIKWYILASLILSVSIYFRPNFALLPFVFLIYMLFNGYKLKEIFKPILIVASIMVLCMSPWWIRNAVVFDDFIPLTLSSGNPMLLGTMINWGYPKSIDENFRDDFELAAQAKTEIESNENQSELAKKIMKYGFKYETKSYIKLYTIDRIVDMFVIPYYWKPVYKIPIEYVKVFHYGILWFGTAGIILSLLLKNKRNDIAILLLVIVYFIITSLPFITFERYGYFVMAFIIFYVSYLIHNIVRMIQESNRRYILELDGVE